MRQEVTIGEQVKKPEATEEMVDISKDEAQVIVSRVNKKNRSLVAQCFKEGLNFLLVRYEDLSEPEASGLIWAVK